MPRTFTTINTGELARKVKLAKESVILAMPGIYKNLANAVVQFSQIGDKRIRIIVDPDPEVCRLGYGDIEGVEILKAAGIPVFGAIGLRIGIAIIDTEAWTFAPTPLAVERHPDASMPNAIRLNPGQAKEILLALIPEEQSISDAEADPPPAPEIGNAIISESQIEQAKQNLKERPPQKFDLSRKVRVYQSMLQFVEVSLKGCYVGRNKVQLPQELFNLGGDDDFKKRLSSQFSLMDADDLAVEFDRGGKKIKVTLASIQLRVKKLRDDFIVSLGERLGNVRLRSNKDRFESDQNSIRAEIDEFKKHAEKAIEAGIKKSKDVLIATFQSRIKESLPQQLLNQIGGDSPTDTQIELYLTGILDRAFPNQSSLLDHMQLDVIYKDITYEMLNEVEFQTTVREKFPLIEWDLLYREEDALKKAIDEE